MFSLLAGFWQLLFRKAEFQVLMLGLDHAGKTTILEQLKGIFGGREPLPPSKITPTVGLNIGRIQLQRVKLIVWDLGGQAALRSIWEKYYSEAHALLYVIDASDMERFEESRDTLQQLLSHPDLAGVPLLLLANKQDAEAALSPLEIRSRLQATLEGVETQQLFATTALNGEGIEEGIRWLVDAMRDSPRVMQQAY